MKEGITMRNANKIGRALGRILCMGALALALLTCEQPFKAGLGPVVDFRAPVVILEKPGSGDFIRGPVRFEGVVNDDYIVQTVQFKVTNKPTLIDGEVNPYQDYQPVVLSVSEWKWYFDLDTSQFEDGLFKIQLMARDSSGKVYESDEIAFRVKNNPPLIRLALPMINDLDEGQDPNTEGRLGGTDLNYSRYTDPVEYSEKARGFDSNGLIVGTIEDNQGVYTGDPDPDNGLYPPQIRFWPVISNTEINYPFANEDDGWEDMQVDPIGLTDVMVRYSLDHAYDRYYAFEIRAFGLDKSRFIFPRDYWDGKENRLLWDSLTPVQQQRNRAVVVYLIQPQDIPTLALWQLEDISVPQIPNPKTPLLPTDPPLVYPPLPGIAADDYHQYVAESVSAKNGAFTLRVKADHPWGIISAIAYFERDGRLEDGSLVRGRLIWDPADRNIHSSPYLSGNTVEVDRPYSEWGVNDPATKININPPSTRTFIFTYRDDGTDYTNTRRYGNVPIANITQAGVANQSKVQLYTGAAWGDWARLEREASNTASWRGLDSLPEGTYTIYVITRADNDSKTASEVPMELTLSIDRQAPMVDPVFPSENGAIRDSAYTGTADASYIVNGVISPKLIINESRSDDSGYRVSNHPYFHRAANGAYGYEQRYVLVRDSQKDLMDAYVAHPDRNGRPWPPYPNQTSAGTTPPFTFAQTYSFAGIDVVKHGAIFDSLTGTVTAPSWRLKLSDTNQPYTAGVAAPAIGSGFSESDGLAEGGAYWLYVFIRDNAFNVGHAKYRLFVDPSSDIPKIITRNSFRFDAPMNDPNQFTPNSSISVTLSDDDSLNLGLGGGVAFTDPNASTVRVSFIGSRVDVSGEESVRYPDTGPINYKVELNDTEIKSVFAPQTLDASGNRIYARERQSSTIRMDHLLLRQALTRHIGGGGFDYLLGKEDTDPNRIPDGLYEFTISVTDYNSPSIYKLTTAGLGTTALAATGTVTFWVRVDSKGPDITGVLPPFAAFISGLAGQGAADITGIVRDENGPITVTDAWVVDVADQDRKRIEGIISKDTVVMTLVSDGSAPGFARQWEYQFRVPVDLSVSGSFDFYVDFMDSYTNTSRLHQRYSLDSQPPSVSLSFEIDTFDRSDYETGSLASVSEDNRERLANKVIRFGVSANDNFQLDGVRWWLLPAGRGAVGQYDSFGAVTVAQALTSTGIVLDFDAYPMPYNFDFTAPVAVPNAVINADGNLFGSIMDGATKIGKFGMFDQNITSNRNMVFIDTVAEGLPDGEYRLHVMARDRAGMLSRNSANDAVRPPDTSIQQTIYLLQDQDLPFISELSPGGNVSGQMWLAGTILDDDGFGPSQNALNNNFSVWAQTARIWLAQGNLSGAVTLGSGTTAPSGGGVTWIVPNNTGAQGWIPAGGSQGQKGLTRQGGDLIIDFDVYDPIAPNKNTMFGANIGIFDADGPKHYVIEISDSPRGKWYARGDGTGGERLINNTANNNTTFTNDGIYANENHADNRVSRRQLFSFVYDTKNPIINITRPTASQAFGPTAGIDGETGQFNITGILADGNLDGADTGKYPIEYRFQSSGSAPTLFKTMTLENGVDGMIVTPITGGIDGTPWGIPEQVPAISFTIPASYVTSRMVDFAALSDGDNSLTITIKDRSGKISTVNIPFVKDQKPPEHSFVGIGSVQAPANWWNNTPADQEAKWTWLAANDPQVPVISYDNVSGKPFLQGTFTDITSPIDIGSVRYWIDGAAETGYRTQIDWDSEGKSARWTIWLTDTGLEGGLPLPDGLHTLKIRIADTSGNRLYDSDTSGAIVQRPWADYAMYAFRIDSLLPEAMITMAGETSVYGASTGFSGGGTIFTIKGTATDNNLKHVRLRIVNSANQQAVIGVPDIIIPGTGVSSPTSNPRWTWTGGAISNPPTGMLELQWEYDIDAATYRDRFADGVTYDVYATAVDHNNDTESERKDESVWAFTKDSALPELTFVGGLITRAADNLTPTQLTIDGANPSANLIASRALQIQGSAIDRHSWFTALDSRIEQWDWDEERWRTDILDPSPPPNTAPGWLPQDWQPLAGSLSGTARSDIRWTRDFTVNNVTLLQQGLYRMQIRAKDASWTQDGTNKPGTDPWQATDIGNPAWSQYMYFYYDRETPAITIDTPVQSFYSSDAQGGSLGFHGTALDPNRIRGVTVALLDGDGNVKIPARNAALNYGRDWSISISVDKTLVPDAAYSLEVTATDGAGRTSTVTRNFTLDNQPPVAKITSPEEKFGASILNSTLTYPRFASAVLSGGEATEITGTTNDTSGNRSESGMAAMWYHIGFFDNRTNADIDLPQNEADIGRLIEADIARRDLTLMPAGIDVFDWLADEENNAWFSMGGTPRNNLPGSTALRKDPTHIEITPTIYGWKMGLPDMDGGLDIGGIKAYTEKITLKSRSYNDTNAGLKTVGDVDPLIAQALDLPGLKYMPLWIRMADVAGNISYYYIEILIYPDGDKPTTTIQNPRNNDWREQRIGGAVGADGVARNNSAVKSVYFRVTVDNVQDPNAGKGANARTVPLRGGQVRLESNDSETSLITTAGHGANDWYRANLEAPAGEKEVPWNFSFNTQQEVTELIETYGFPVSGSGPADTIRVYLEVLVFRGTSTTPATRVSDLYVRRFYLKIGAPVISDFRVGSVTAGVPGPSTGPSGSNAVTTPYQGAGVHRFRGNFGIRAALFAGQQMRLGQVAIRRPQEVDLQGNPTGWVIAWENGSPVPATGMPGLSVSSNSSDGSSYLLDFHFNSTATLPQTGYALIKDGAWASTGGSYEIEIRIRDNATDYAEAVYGFEIGIDNFAPVADPRLETRKRVAGAYVDFQGRVFDYFTPWDTGTPRRIQRVRAWFTKTVNGSQHFVRISGSPTINGQTEEIREGSAGTYVGTGTRTGVYRDRTARVEPNPGETVSSIAVSQTGTITTTNTMAQDRIHYPSAGAGTNAAFAGNDWVREISQSLVVPGSRMVWETNGGNPYDIIWSFNIDTTRLPDGPLNLHYIVEDEVGNSAYYVQPNIVVRNKYPQLDRVTLYTDNNGIGAVYTGTTGSTENIASVEYRLDAYSRIMTGTPSSVSTTLPTGGTLLQEMKGFGYLNSGFFSKNQYIGFKVESSDGNPNVNYRLQYVRRGGYNDGGTGNFVPNTPTRLTRANLNRMIQKREAGTGINLYTIAWDGGYTDTRWAAVGVHSAAPPLGTHFVYSMTTDELPTNPDTGAPDPATNALGWVWEYESVLPAKQTDPMGRSGGIINMPALPNEPGTAGQIEPGHGFNFIGDAFDPAGTAVAGTKISDFDGSRPKSGPSWDEDDHRPDNPDDTAFFLIRVWDTVNPLVTDENQQLYDAVVVGMNVVLLDDTKPLARLYDLNPYTEEEVVGNNIGTAYDSLTGTSNVNNTWLTIRSALDPAGSRHNILRGGLFNVSTDREHLVRSGHIEPRSGTRALNPVIANHITGVPIGARDRADGRSDTDTDINTFIAGDSYPAPSWVAVPRDMVSGKIILRGQAYDDQIIREIRVYIGTETTIDPSTHPLYSPANGKSYAILELDKTSPRGSRSFRTMRPVNGAQAWVAETMHWKDGHTVEWAYVWDTEKIPASVMGTPTENVRIWVAAIDDLGGGGYDPNPADLHTRWTGLVSSQVLETDTGDNVMNRNNSFAVDIVPYIIGFEREEQYVTRRSLQGWYSFFRGEANIAAVGYNLIENGSDNPATISIFSGANGTTETALTRTGTQTQNRILFTVPQDAVSGKIVVKTGTEIRDSDETMNHRTSMTQSWNQEYFYGTSGSELWVNRPHAHIWRSQQGSGGASEAPVTFFRGSDGGHENPGMALQYSTTGTGASMLHGAWAAYTRGNIYRSRNDNVADTLVSGGGVDPYGNSDIALQNGSTTYSIVGVWLSDRNPDLRIYNNATGAGTNIMTPTPIPTQSFQNARIARSAAQTYMTTYFAYGRRLMFSMAPGNLARNIDGSRTDGISQNEGAGSGANGFTIYEPTSGLGRTDDAGRFSAVDYDNVGPIIAYYDGTNDTVRVMFGMVAAPNGYTTATRDNWRRVYLLPEDHALFRGSGQYVSIKVDSANGIHFAFYNSAGRGSIVYAYAQDRNVLLNRGTTQPNASSNYVAYIVDPVVKGGTYTDISVDGSGNPWIVYGDMTRTTGYDGARMAYRSAASTGFAFTGGTLTCPETGADISAWEAVQVPAPYLVRAERLNIEAWPPTNRGSGTLTTPPGWNAAVGYSSDMFRISYFYYPTYKGYSRP